MITIDAIDDETYKIDNKIASDLYALRQHNPSYLNQLDEYGYKIEEEEDSEDEV
jgi:hypothetical protein